MAALAFIFLGVSGIARAQTYQPSDWDNPQYQRYSGYITTSGAGIGYVADDGSYVDAKTPQTNGYPTQDYAYATATCDAVFLHHGPGPANFYAAGTFHIQGSFVNQGYGGSGVAQVSNGGTAGHNYNVGNTYGYGPIMIDATQTTVTIEFQPQATCHSNGGVTSAQGQVDKNVD